MKRLVVVLSLLITLLMPASVLAYDPFQAACSNGGSTSAACQVQNPSQNPLGGPNGLLKKITILVAVVAGIAAVIIIILSGMKFITAQGDPQAIAGARSSLLGAVIGLVIIVSAEGILLFVINHL